MDARGCVGVTLTTKATRKTRAGMGATRTFVAAITRGDTPRAYSDGGVRFRPRWTDAWAEHIVSPGLRESGFRMLAPIFLRRYGDTGS